jgi:hypothetical protein
VEQQMINIWGLACLLISAAIPAANEKNSESVSPNLLRNGNFSFYQGGSRPADWNIYIKAGQYDFLTDPIPAESQNSPLSAIIVARESGQACYYQDVQVFKGNYHFEAEVQAVSTARAAVIIGDQTSIVPPSADWKKVAFDFSASGTIRVHLYSLSSGTAKFRNAQLLIRSLDCSSVPFSDGSVLGSIVLPENPSPAEKYAGYELQKFIARMTGHVPGIAGRDVCPAGRKIVIGGTVPDSLKDLPSDSYLIDQLSDAILLAGNTPRGTLYAVYDFLKTQGCGWYMPGEIGQVIPERASLYVSHNRRIESPDYAVRGMMVWSQRFFPDGGWNFLNMADYLDWAVRNRVNAIWYGAARTGDFEDFRGGSYGQTLNHSWNQFLNDEHSEWWPMVDGRRLRTHISGRPNELCVSNRELRTQAVETILKHFKAHPEDSAFALNPNDEPAFWCECSQCRALDADGGKGLWKKAADGSPELSMTDRVLNFVNEVADRVAKVYPEKQIEVYAYASYRNPPKKEKVHPNVLIKYTFWPGFPFNQNLSDRTIPYSRQTGVQLDGWKKIGAKHLALYDYGNYIYPDCPWLNFHQVADYLRTFHDQWGFEQCLGETSNLFPVSLMMYNLRAAVLWKTQTDYKTVINDICDKFYGPAAGEMKDYYASMDSVLMKSNAWKKKGWDPLKFCEYTTKDLLRGREILERADRKVRDNATLKARVAIARYGHAFWTFTLVQNLKSPSRMDKDTARQAHALANKLCRDYRDIIPLSQNAVEALKNIYFPPTIAKTLFHLPLTWQFKKDPEDCGLTEKWYVSALDKSWQPILINKDWTSQGHSYHGVAWYAIKFSVPKENTISLDKEKGKRVLYFGAVDGEADMYLDGKKIGEQKIDPGYMWDKAFTIPLPIDFNASGPHSLVIRVKKNIQAAGIWKPVWITILSE